MIHSPKSDQREARRERGKGIITYGGPQHIIIKYEPRPRYIAQPVHVHTNSTVCQSSTFLRLCRLKGERLDCSTFLFHCSTPYSNLLHVPVVEHCRLLQLELHLYSLPFALICASQSASSSATLYLFHFYHIIHASTHATSSDGIYLCS